jgi:hypothetical protein
VVPERRCNVDHTLKRAFPDIFCFLQDSVVELQKSIQLFFVVRASEIETDLFGFPPKEIESDFESAEVAHVSGVGAGRLSIEKKSERSNAVKILPNVFLIASPLV